MSSSFFDWKISTLKCRATRANPDRMTSGEQLPHSAVLSRRSRKGTRLLAGDETNSPGLFARLFLFLRVPSLDNDFFPLHQPDFISRLVRAVVPLEHERAIFLCEELLVLTDD